jgi:hypothetical protein
MYSISGGIGVWSQGLAFARQVLYHLSHAPAFFDLDIHWIGSCIYVQASLDRDPPINAFHIAGVIGMHHHAQL